MTTSCDLALSIEGQLDLECLFRLVAYLGKYQNAEMLFDPTEPHQFSSISEA